MKLVTLDDMIALAAGYRRDGKTVVFTYGRFDLLHVGHVTYLEQAAALGDVLVVAVNSDSSIRQPGKGPERPIVPEADRAATLAALACVDHVLIVEQATPHRLLEAIRPDVLVKGGTYTVDQVVGHEIVERYGGRVCVTGKQPGVSTTTLVAEIERRRESRIEAEFKIAAPCAKSVPEAGNCLRIFAARIATPAAIRHGADQERRNPETGRLSLLYLTMQDGIVRCFSGGIGSVR